MSREILENSDHDYKQQRPHMLLKIDKPLQLRRQLNETGEFNKESRKNTPYLKESGDKNASEVFSVQSFGACWQDEENHSSNDFVACAIDTVIQIWKLDSNESVTTLEEHSDKISSLEILDETRFASGSWDRTIKIWSISNGDFACHKTIVTDNKVECLKSLTSNRIASGSWRAIKIWDTTSGACMHSLSGHSDWIRCLIRLSNGNQLMSASFDKTLKVWDWASGGGVCLKTLTGHTASVFCLVLLRNGHVASGCWDGTIKIWDADRGMCLITLRGHTEPICRLYSFTSGELVSASKDKTLKIWDLNCKEVRCMKTMHGHTKAIVSVYINQCDKSNSIKLVSCSFDGTIKKWDFNTGMCVSTFHFSQGFPFNLKDLICI